MNAINELKESLIGKYNSLTDERKKELREYFDKSHDVSVQNEIIRDTKENAQDVIDYADRQGYGYGEVGYNLNEIVKDFAEDVPELEKEYKRLQSAYFNLLIEAKES